MADLLYSVLLSIDFRQGIMYFLMSGTILLSCFSRWMRVLVVMVIMGVEVCDSMSVRANELLESEDQEVTKCYIYNLP